MQHVKFIFVQYYAEGWLSKDEVAIVRDAPDFMSCIGPGAGFKAGDLRDRNRGGCSLDWINLTNRGATVKRLSAEEVYTSEYCNKGLRFLVCCLLLLTKKVRAENIWGRAPRG